MNMKRFFRTHQFRNGRMTAFLLIITLLVAVGMVQTPSFAASKYGEDMPLTKVKSGKVYIEDEGHYHSYIEANNGIRYFLYKSCMNGCTGSAPTNHSAYVTIDGVEYTLCNYSRDGYVEYANVIKKVDGFTDTTEPVLPETEPVTQQPTQPTQVSIPLESISLNKTSVTAYVYDCVTLKVTYNPNNTTIDKRVKWSSSNSAVASVSGGEVYAKKAGKVTITATCSGKKAKCQITVKNKESYKNVTEAYTLLNTFRTAKSNQWYWKPDNKSKTYVYGLKKVKGDAELEKIAKKRAKEQWTMYYERGLDTHTRPNGKDCETAYPTKVRYAGENTAWGQSTCKEVINDWAEKNKKYCKQGHRRNMLNKSVKRVGIACYEKNGYTCWAMSLGY